MHLAAAFDEHVPKIIDHDFGHVGRFEVFAQRSHGFKEHFDRALFERAQFEQGVFGSVGHAVIVPAVRYERRAKATLIRAAFDEVRGPLSSDDDDMGNGEVWGGYNRLQPVFRKAPENRVAFECCNLTE
jgi:hypothetical protein